MPPSSPRPYILNELTWKTVRDARYEVAVLPWGATEAHNLHLPYSPDNVETARIAELAAKNRLPTISDSKDFLDAGGLLSYGSDRLALWRRTAWYVDKILKGTPPGNLPIERAVKFELIVNQKTAKTLDVTVPLTLIARADQVID